MYYSWFGTSYDDAWSCRGNIFQEQALLGLSHSGRLLKYQLAFWVVGLPQGSQGLLVVRIQEYERLGWFHLANDLLPVSSLPR
jgi:hypothetical protein